MFLALVPDLHAAGRYTSVGGADLYGPLMASPALRLYIGLAVTSSLLSAAFFTIAPIYRIQEAGLTPLQLVLVGTVMEATVLVFELPTGIVADNVSRKRSVVIGVTITGIAFVLEGAIADVRTILVASALWGFGWTSSVVPSTPGSQVKWATSKAGTPSCEAGSGAGSGRWWASWPVGGLVWWRSGFRCWAQECYSHWSECRCWQ